jgi:pyruvate/2-oxoglutarate/acetoin dehydrogenase E1 component
VTVVTYSGMVGPCLAAAESLAKRGTSVELIDLRTISPWDEETVLNSVAKTKRAVVVHEAARRFGVGAEIAATIGKALFGSLRAPIQRVGSPDCPVPFSKPLEAAFLPDETRITSAIMKTLEPA